MKEQEGESVRSHQPRRQIKWQWEKYVPLHFSLLEQPIGSCCVRGNNKTADLIYPLDSYALLPSEEFSFLRMSLGSVLTTEEAVDFLLEKVGYVFRALGLGNG